MLLHVPDHPLVKRALSFGMDAPPRGRCPCGAPAEVWSSVGGYMCRRCALDTWYLLDENTRLERLGCESLS